MWTCILPFSFLHKLSACLSEQELENIHLLVPFPHWGKKNHRKHLHCTHPFYAPQMLFGFLSSCLLPTSLLHPPSFFLLAGHIRHGVSHTPLHIDCCLQGSFLPNPCTQVLLGNKKWGELPYCCFWPSRLELQMEFWWLMYSSVGWGSVTGSVEVLAGAGSRSL